MKTEYERQINEYIKEKAMDNIKLETLSKKMQDNERARNEVVDRFKREISDREHMKRQVEVL